MSRKDYVRTLTLDMAGEQTQLLAENTVKVTSPMLGNSGLPHLESASVRVPGSTFSFVASVGADDERSVSLQQLNEYGQVMQESKILRDLVDRPSILGIYSSPSDPGEVSVMCLAQQRGRGNPDVLRVVAKSGSVSVTMRVSSFMLDNHTKWIFGSTNPYFHSPGVIYVLNVIQPDQTFKRTLVVQNLETRQITPLVTEVEEVGTSSLAPMGQSLYALGSVEYDNPLSPSEGRPFLSIIDGSQAIPAIAREELSLEPIVSMDPMTPSGVPQRFVKEASAGAASVAGSSSLGKAIFAANVESETKVLGNTRFSTMLWVSDTMTRDDSSTSLTPAQEPVVQSEWKLSPQSLYGVSKEGFWIMRARPQNNGVDYQELFLDADHAKLGAAPLSDEDVERTYMRLNITGAENTVMGYRTSPFTVPRGHEIERINLSARVQVNVKDSGRVRLGFTLGSLDGNFPSVMPSELFGLRTWEYTQNSSRQTHDLFSADVPMQSIFGPGKSLVSPLVGGGLLGGLYIAESTSTEAAVVISDLKIKVWTRPSS